jgi:CRP-like cAMP-binding protein
MSARFHVDASAAAQAAVAALLVPRAFAVDEYLLRAGERAEWCFFIERGLVRELYIDDAGATSTRAPKRI